MDEKHHKRHKRLEPQEPPLAVCTFGWGQKFRLYRDYLEVRGKHYPLTNLTSLRPIYQRVMGVSSVRLELHFGKQKLSLRGIAATGEIQTVLEYLTAQDIHVEQPMPELSAAAWHRLQPLRRQFKAFPNSQSRSQLALDARIDVIEEYSPVTSNDLCVTRISEARTAKVEATPNPNWQRFRTEQHERRQHRIQVEHSLREHGFDVEALAHRLQDDPLPVISVPVRLPSGESAHYSTEATLCGEPLSESLRYTYPARDYGTLMLTNRRMIYIGRKSQIVLDYAQLLRVSRLRSAIALQAEHWYKREIFEIARPLECTMYFECILQEFHREKALQAQTCVYAGYEKQFEAAVARATVDTMPLPAHSWNMTEIAEMAGKKRTKRMAEIMDTPYQG